MKNLNKNIFLNLVMFTITLFNLSAQEYAMNNVNLPEGIIYNEVKPLIKNKTFSYKYKGEDVFVVFKGTEHIEYFNNKKYYIKSRVFWNSKQDCSMILEESNLPEFKFKKGTKLEMKITKVKQGYIYYESTLGGRTWEGKMKEI